MKREEVLAVCIKEFRAVGLTVAECLVRYPQYADELRVLLALAAAVQPEPVTPSAEFKERLRQRLAEITQGPAPRNEDNREMGNWRRLLPSPRASVIALVLFIALSVFSAVAYASQTSLPGDFLYPVKTLAENLRHNVTFGQEQKARLRLVLAQNRIDEVTSQLTLERKIDPSSLLTIAEHIDEAIKEMGGASAEATRAFSDQLLSITQAQEALLNRVLEKAPEQSQPAIKQAVQAAQRGSMIAEVARENPAFLASLPSVKDEKLEMGYFSLEGNLLSAEGGTWNVGGIIISGVNSPHVPPAGIRVKIEAVARGDKLFVGKIEYKEGNGNRVKIEGPFLGDSPDGLIWNVNGIPVSRPPGEPVPQKGSRLELSGTVKDGVLIAEGRDEGKSQPGVQRPAPGGAVPAPAPEKPGQISQPTKTEAVVGEELRSGDTGIKPYGTATEQVAPQTSDGEVKRKEDRESERRVDESKDKPGKEKEPAKPSDVTGAPEKPAPQPTTPSQPPVKPSPDGDKPPKKNDAAPGQGEPGKKESPRKSGEAGGDSGAPAPKPSPNHGPSPGVDQGPKQNHPAPESGSPGKGTARKASHKDQRK